MSEQASTKVETTRGGKAARRIDDSRSCRIRLFGPAAKYGGARGLAGWQRKRVFEFIENHLAETISISALAALVQLSPYHFARAFKQTFGLPPHRYHMSRRVERAKVLLADRSVTEVAIAVGYAETSSFSASFRRTTGVSPSEFRRAL